VSQTQTSDSITKMEFLEGYDKVFINRNLADIVKLTLYKKSKRDDFANSTNHSFIFEIENDENWDKFYGSKITIQFVPIEEERVLLNEISKRQNIKSEYFSYDIVDNLSKESDNIIIGPDNKRYFRINVNSRLKLLEDFNVFLINKQSNKPFGRKIHLKTYSLAP